MESNEYVVKVKNGKDEQEISIEIDMIQYGKSFDEDLLRLGSRQGASTIKEDKIEFLNDLIMEQAEGNVSVGKRELKRLMKEVDDDYKSYTEEIDGYSNNDDE